VAQEAVSFRQSPVPPIPRGRRSGVAETDPASKLTDQGLGPIKVASMTNHAAASQLANCVALRRVADALRAHPDIAPGDALAVADLLEKLALAPPPTFKKKRARRDDLLPRGGRQVLSRIDAVDGSQRA
jgi:hypothetical protein